MANPQVPQGTLNRLRASITLTSFPNLNITASYLGREGISLTFDGVVTTPIDSMTGIVPSPEPYQRITVSAHLLKSQALANAYKAQIELNSLLGDVTVRPDVAIGTGIGAYQLSNCYINTVNALKFDGTDAGWIIMIGGIYLINSALWNL